MVQLPMRVLHGTCYSLPAAVMISYLMWLTNSWASGIALTNLLTTTSKIWPPGAPKLGALLIFMSSLGCLTHWDAIVIRTPPISSSKMSKTG